MQTRKSAPTRAIHEDETYSEKVIAWAAEKYPTVDVPETFDVFADHCRSAGSMYADWDAALRQWIRNGIDKAYGGVKLKKPKTREDLAKERGVQLKERAAAMGFREPLTKESFDDYERAIDAASRANVGRVTQMVRGIGK